MGCLGVNVEVMAEWVGVMKDFYVKVGRPLYVLHNGRNRRGLGC